MDNNLKAGDFTGLASDYSSNRPDYCDTVLCTILNLLSCDISDADFVDVGAGTGIWTRLVASKGLKSATAVEPNSDMLNHGISDSSNTAIAWLSGSAEDTNLADNSADWLTMASSFHWADFELATKEFYRVLKPSGLFTAIWNPRLIEVNPLLVEIESHLDTLRPNIKRVSSGRSGMTSTLFERLESSPYFDDVVYIEGRHVIKMSPDRYLGAWRSVNDLRVQLGPLKFGEFLDYVEQKISGLPYIEATYLTRSWTARSVKR